MKVMHPRLTLSLYLIVQYSILNSIYNMFQFHAFSLHLQRRKSRMSESSPVQGNGSFLPKVASSSQKPSTYQPNFTSTYGSSQLPKLGATSTYLPQLPHANAFVAKPAKSTKPQVYEYYSCYPDQRFPKFKLKY